jgi:hypothetical protein
MMLVRASLAATAIAALLQSSGGAVAGMAIDATGRPLPATLVVLFDQAAKREYVTTTDAAGVFRLDAVATGKYMVVATRAGYLSAEYGAPWPGDPGWLAEIGASGRTDLTLTLRKGGAISGTVTDENGDPLTALVIARHLVKGTQKQGLVDSHGQYRIANLLPGPYVISAGANDGPLYESSDQRMIRPPIYYNGATDAAQATLVTIAGEPEISGIDFQLRPVPVTTTPVGSQPDLRSAYFLADDLPFALQSQPGRILVAVSGRIVFEGASRRDFMEPFLLAVSNQPTGSFLSPPPPSQRSLMVGLNRPAVSLEGFTVKAYPGTYIIGWQPRSAPWSVKAMTSGGRDILDLPITLSPNAPIDDAVVTFTDKATEVSGFLVGSDGAPLLGAMAMIFSADARYWYPGSGRIQMVLGDGTGRYMLSALSPGEYRTTLVTPEVLASTHRLGLSEILTRFSAGSGTFTLSEGERKQVDIPGRRSGIVR